MAKLNQVFRHCASATVVVHVDVTDRLSAKGTADNNNWHLQTGKSPWEFGAEFRGHHDQTAHASLMAEVDALADVVEVLGKAVI